jgi:hypothetical protein
MFDSFPQNGAQALLLGPHGAAKMNLSGGLSRDEWDSIFGAGTADALEGRAGGLSAPEAWTRQGWFRKCADTRAKAVATLPWALYPAAAANDAKPLWKDDDVAVPPGLEALDGLTDSFYLSEASLSLCGAFYFGKRMGAPGGRQGKLGRFGGLMYWNPLTVKPEIGAEGLSVFKRSVGQQVIPVDPEAVVWGWALDPFVEMGPGASDGRAAAANAATLDAMARLDGGLIKMTVLAIEEGQRTSPEQRSELRRMWARLLRRGADRDGPPVLSHGVKPHTIGEGLKEMGNKDLTDEQRQSIATTFGIPWSILTSEAANFATAQVEERGFYIRTVIPQARLIERAMNRRLLNEYGLMLRFEPERHEVMQQYEVTKAEAIALLIDKVYTREEARVLMGLDPKPSVGEFPKPVAPQPPAGGDGAPVPVRSISLEDRIARIVGEGR